MSRIILDPLIPLSLWVPLVLIAAALLVWYGYSSRKRLTQRRRWAILTLMGVAFVLPLTLLLNPTWMEPIPPPPGRPQLTILVDQSASMETRDAASGRSRYENAVQSAREAAKQFESKYDVRIFGFDKELHSTWNAGAPPANHAGEAPTLHNAGETPAVQFAVQAEGTATDLGAAIEQSLRSEQPQGHFMLLLSDGANNVGTFSRVRESLTKAKAMAVPIFTRTSTETSDVNDLELELGLSQEIAFAAQHVPVTVRVRQRGSSVRTARVVLKLDDQTLEQRDVELTADLENKDGTVETTWMIMQPKSGLYRYEIFVEPLPGEVTVVNNTATLLLRVVEEPVRVLLLEGKPYWDTKYLVRTLSADPSIELTSVVQLSPGRLHRRKIWNAGASPAQGVQIAGGAPTLQEEASALQKTENWTTETQAERFLVEEEELNQYQIVVLGRDAEIFLSGPDSAALTRLKKWLAEGTGSLVCFRGAPTSQINERLGQLLPVRWEPSLESRFRLQMTPAGQALRWLPGHPDSDDLLPEMPSLASVTKPKTPKPLAVVLASAQESGHSVPLITYQPVGNGRVIVVEGAGMWRWAFLPPTYQDRDEVYAALWRSLVRWLVSNVGLLPSQEMVLRTDTTTFSTDEVATAMLLLREDRLETPPEVELSGEALEKPRKISPVPSGEPGQYRLVFGRLPEGRYQAKIVDKNAGTGDNDKLNLDEVSGLAEFDVRGNLRERLDVAAEPEVMQAIARETGGSEFAGDDWNELDRQFSEHLTRIHPARSTQTPLWDRWWTLLGVFSLWACSWAVRRFSGLV